MLKNYFKIAVRNMLKHRAYAAVNIWGLATGIACCVLIFAFVYDEWTYDNFHKNGDEIYRMYHIDNFQGSGIRSAIIPSPLAKALAAEIPEIIRSVRCEQGGAFFKYQDKTFYEGILFTDSDIFKIFTFPLLKGDSITALQNPNSIVISEEVATKFFGEENPLGKQLTLMWSAGSADYIVTGVTKKIPRNSSIRFNILLTIREGSWGTGSWDYRSKTIYVQVAKGTQVHDLERKLPELLKKYKGKYNLELDRYGFQPLKDTHLDPTVEGGLSAASDPLYSYILSGLALAVLFIACVNFVNLSIASASNRLKEICVRQVFGSRRIQIMKQFFGEAIFMGFFAVLLGMALAELGLSTFNSLSGKNFTLNYLSNQPTLFGLTGLILFVGIIAGSYPALYLSSLQPVEILKSKFKIGGANLFSRTLVVIQFALSSFLIIGTMIMYRQLDYLKEKSLGYDDERIIVISPDYGEAKLLKIYRNALSQYDQILKVAGSSYAFNSGGSFAMVSFEDFTGTIATLRVDHDFLETLGIELVDGRNFSKDFPSDLSDAVIVNQTLVNELGWDSLIGRKISPLGKTVIGVVKDFHFQSLHCKIIPVAIQLVPETEIGCIYVKVEPENINHVLAFLEKEWKKIIPNLPFDYFLLNKDMDGRYRSEGRWGKIMGNTSAFAITIACMGLFSLAALASASRTKEIGIRKVLGASVRTILILLSKEFTRLVLISNIIAWPIAYYMMKKWLQNFAYRVDIGWWVFALAGGLALLIALLTVSTQAIKAALANPVEALRYE